MFFIWECVLSFIQEKRSWSRSKISLDFIFRDESVILFAFLNKNSLGFVFGDESVLDFGFQEESSSENFISILGT